MYNDEASRITTFKRNLENMKIDCKTTPKTGIDCINKFCSECTYYDGKTLPDDCQQKNKFFKYNKGNIL